MTATNRGFFIYAVISAIGVAIACFTFLPAHFAGFKHVRPEHPVFGGNPRWIAFGAILIGIMLVSAIQLLTGYFTEANRRPVRDIGNGSKMGAVTVILSGVSTGMEFTMYSACRSAARSSVPTWWLRATPPSRCSRWPWPASAC